MSAGTTTSVAVLADWCRVARSDLAARREQIDLLNVFPVPDTDTGTNLLLTMEEVTRAAEDLEPGPGDLGRALRLLARAALVGAHGNSGAILAELLRGAAAELAEATEPDGTDLARALCAASTAAYVAVEHPVEGTMLSVIRAASAAAAERSGAPVAEVSAAAAEAARQALAATTGQLDVLRRAGVVDAGGFGLVVLLEALHGVLAGKRTPGDNVEPPVPTPAPAPAPRAAAVLGAGAGPGSAGDRYTAWSGGTDAGSSYSAQTYPGPSGSDPSYEVLYLLDADDSAIPRLRAVLAPLGDSLVVTGGERLWNVHIHVDDPGAAIEAGVAAGRPHRIRVTYLDPVSRCVPTRALVAVAAGRGLAELFGGAGATVVGAPATAEDILAAIQATGAAEIVVLPNDPDGGEIAEQAAVTARTSGLRVAVLPTATQVQGLAACAVHDAAAGFDDDVVAMTAAAGHTRHGAVTVARKDALTSAGPCRRGDVLGVVEGDFALIGTEVDQVGREVLARLLAGGGELVTVITGAGADHATALRVLDGLRDDRPDLDTVVYDGGQAGYPLLIGVE